MWGGPRQALSSREGTDASGQATRRFYGKGTEEISSWNPGPVGPDCTTDPGFITQRLMNRRAEILKKSDREVVMKKSDKEARGAGVVPAERIARAILLIRGEKVLLDADLAGLYQVETAALKRAVRRNRERFPKDFMFQLTDQEVTNLRCQFGTSRSWGGRRFPPYAFTEQGVAMLSSVLRSQRAVAVNIEIMRAFVKLREMLAGNRELAEKLAQLEKKYDKQFKTVFDAIFQLMAPEMKSKRPIGFAPWPKDGKGNNS